jgi:hypothetical protein
MMKNILKSALCALLFIGTAFAEEDAYQEQADRLIKMWDSIARKYVTAMNDQEVKESCSESVARAKKMYALIKDKMKLTTEEADELRNLMEGYRKFVYTGGENLDDLRILLEELEAIDSVLNSDASLKDQIIAVGKAQFEELNKN